MGLMQDHFPVFEANQVLTSGHLNDVFNYLDEQARLTRSNLIGIGIVCGLEIEIKTGRKTAIHLSKGCGVTSQGYLIVEPVDVDLVSYRANYLMPTDPDYPAFKDATTKTQYPLWELFPEVDPNTTLVGSVAGFLDDKAVLLFLELKRRALRNCSPNNCDDKGAEVTASIKRLLIKRDDLDKIIAAANALGGGLTSSDLASVLSEKLNLPDVHLPRFDVPNSYPATSNDIFGAFLNVFRAGKLAQKTGEALNKAYTAFKPLLQAAYPVNPFSDFMATFGFLDTAPVTTVQVRFLQYYVDLFDDLLRAYDEFRWKGAELICACCPPDDLFPRHLMLGLLHPAKVSQSSIYRQGFLAAFAIGDCAGRTEELLQLFGRLVEMTKRFTNEPTLAKANDEARIDPQIRVTPSKLGDKPLSGKAIPYYYQQNGTPPLYRLWSHEKTRRNRANQNLSYRYDEYDPAAPPFIGSPLRYDLEPYNFLRIEGDLGKNYQRVLSTLLLLKSQYRLPVEVIALRSGVYDDTQPVELRKESARFQDLEALYDALREELLSSFAEGIRYLYDIHIGGRVLRAGTQPVRGELPGDIPLHSLLKTHAPNYRYSINSVGDWYEKNLSVIQSKLYIEVNQNLIDSNAVQTVYSRLFNGTTDLPPANYAHAVSIYYFSKLAEILPMALDALAYADFENKYQDLLGMVRFFRSEAIRNISPGLQTFIPQDELIDHFNQVLFSSKLDPIKSVHDEYVRRIRELRKKQFLSNFLQQHPGIQHKAGVPLGGTFIIVYHDKPSVILTPMDNFSANTAELTISKATTAETAPEMEASGNNFGSAINARTAASSNRLALIDAINRIGSDRGLASNPDISLVLGSLKGRKPIFDPNLPLHGLNEQASKIISTAVNELADGTVIADFFLPYLISSDYAAVQFVLANTPPRFSAEIGSPNADGFASVTVKATGGMAPYQIKIDKEDYKLLGEPLLLKAGLHTLTLRDAEGTESSSQSVTVAPPISFEPAFKRNDAGTSYTATFRISGGTPPYAVNGKTIAGNTYTTNAVASGTAVSLEVVDRNQSVGRISVTHTCVRPLECDLPCSGIALRRGYRFWLPEPEKSNPYTSFAIEKLLFKFEFPQGSWVNLSVNVQDIIQPTTVSDLNGNFTQVAELWVNKINELIASKTTRANWLVNIFRASTTTRANWLTLNYEKPVQPGRLGTLWIEYFQCLKFEIQVVSLFGRGNVEERLIVAYGPEGTTVQGVVETNEVSVKIPAFDGTKINKCDPQTSGEKLCAEVPNFELHISKTVDGQMASLKVEASGPEKPVEYLWEIQDVRPAMANGQSVVRSFTSNVPKNKLLNVTAFTEKGCRVMKEDTIELG